MRLAALFPENPVLSRELRTRMRGARAPWLLFAYVGTLSLILFVVYFAWARSQADSITGGMGGAAAASFSIGRTFYEVLFVIQALLVTLITPALTAGGISIEKEQRTYEMLSVSLLPRRHVVLGKLAAAVAFVGLLLTASLPLVSLCFLLGGVSPGEVGAAYVSLLATAFVYGAAGIAWSAVARDTTAATLLAYATVALLFFASLPLAVPYLPGFYGGSAGAFGLASLNPVGAVLYGTRPESYFGHTVPGWVPAVCVNLMLGAALTAAALHRLEYPATGRAWLVRLLTVALCMVLVALFCGGLHASYSASGFRGAVAAGSTGLTAAARRTFVCWLVAFLPCLLAPIFATGAGLYGDAAHRRRAGEPLSGLAFVVVTTGVCGAILAALGYGVGLRPFALMVPFVAFGLAGIGLLCSAALRNRWTALQATLALSLGLFVIPYSVATARRGGENGRASSRVALLYLSPHPAALEAGDPQRSIPAVPPDPPFAPVTGAVYFGFGIVTVPLAFLVQRSRARRDAAANPG